MKTGKSNIKFLQQQHKNCQASAYFDMRINYVESKNDTYSLMRLKWQNSYNKKQGALNEIHIHVCDKL